ncbi:kinase domain protein [Aeromicrobium marinum DSM 15272]|uniref:non-specific serine/threonine protein kinase n=1 Tax=Aeromicrobium marinum DSM 15272 TaxID=585531 RepID=E2SAH7_9ACTN|nr:serine/threonine-protein kinase [Aeromicrobium marinum]EFQ84251.1 kinase domain protein [Aeromicrobium marinum DSM 15272]
MSDPSVTSPVPGVADARFELLARIGAGNHGVVFRARDRQLGREVAVKRFSHVLTDDPRAMRRITREVETLARVSHPNVVTVHDLVNLTDGDGEVTPQLVMELVEGTSLRQLLADRGPSPRSVLVVRGVLEGLVACHAADILHLDIKPANVLVTPTGGVKIVDFGIARAASDATATIAGTPPYMAPEQSDGRADERSDIYSVGCLLYECLTGRSPFEGTMSAQLMAHRHDPRPDPRAFAPNVGAELAAVVMRAMAIDPADRYGDVRQMLAAVTAVGVPAAGPPPMPTGPAPDDVRTGHVAPVPAPAPSPPPYPSPVQASPVTRWSKLGTYGAGLAVCAFVVALVPGLVWGLSWIVPGEYRPGAWSDANGTAWWLLAVAVALLVLRRRDGFVTDLGGPAVGATRTGRVLADDAGRSIRAAARAAAAGSLPMLFPVYVWALALAVGAAGLTFPSDVFGTAGGIFWVLLPVAAAVLLVRGAGRIRFRLGSLVLSVLYFGAAAAAVVFFLAYPGFSG